MARPRSLEAKSKIDDLREKLDEISKREKPVIAVSQEADSYQLLKDKESFKAWWAAKKKEYKRPKELEEILWAHLKATGNSTPDKFETGVEHFGLKK
jgi:hypothetical protein